MSTLILDADAVKEFNNICHARHQARIPMDVRVAERNLLDARRIADQAGLTPLLVFGTLLGAYRDGCLIAHDTDTDVGLLPADAHKLIEEISKGAFAQAGLRLGRVVGKQVLTLVRDGEYLDIYCFAPSGKGTHRCLHYWIEDTQLTPVGSIDFLGQRWATVNDPERYFERLYGSDWRTPIPYRHADT